ncbi:conserved membrane hypothetical protein [Phycicoccus elongatus Lp2]|uniref:Uncharacterized protein n=1 Tax=Phycicoccus elongatus Lp2 TaxID=1193181 RepID=N0E165_9MICO|nr:CbtA family protein [Phycicoccus elongatus]CCH70678.1 conserved membrane hypothetical protein [Phycicoccus elongatus Lp2]
MTARAILLRGLLAGLIAGIATFAVAYTVGEPHVERAISLEEAAATAAEAPAPAEDDGHSHSHDEEGTEVSRSTQSTVGLLTGTLTVSVAIGGVVSLIAAAVAGRLGRIGLGGSTALVAAVGFVGFALVPFLKYPSTPPAVGNGETIGTRTALYFGFLLVSVVAAVAAVLVANRLAATRGAYTAVVVGLVGYVVVVVVAGLAFPTVNEVGDFPADTLWFFRRASLFTLTTMWAVIGIVLTGLLLRLQTQQAAPAATRELQPAH